MFFNALAAAKERRILKLFLKIIDENGYTFVQHLFGVPGIDTMDPENIEAVLSTKFTGNMLYCMYLRVETDLCFKRLRSGLTSDDVPCAAGRWHIHARRSGLEGFTTIASTTICIKPGTELCRNPGMRGTPSQPDLGQRSNSRLAAPFI